MSPIYGGPSVRAETIDCSPNWYPLTAKTVTATSKQVAPDYSYQTSYFAQRAPYFMFSGMLVWFACRIGSFGGGGNTLSYSIEIDGVEVGTGTLSTGGSTGDKKAVHDIYGVDDSFIIPVDYLVKVYLWVNAGSCVLAAGGYDPSIKVVPGYTADGLGYGMVQINAFPGSAAIAFLVTPSSVLSQLAIWWYALDGVGGSGVDFLSSLADVKGAPCYWPPAKFFDTDPAPYLNHFLPIHEGWCIEHFDMEWVAGAFVYFDCVLQMLRDN